MQTQVVLFFQTLYWSTTHLYLYKPNYEPLIYTPTHVCIILPCVGYRAKNVFLRNSKCALVYYFHPVRVYIYIYITGWCLCGVMVKAMDCGIVVSKFELQSRYYIHFRANTLGKSMNPLILPAMG